MPAPSVRAETPTDSIDSLVAAALAGNPELKAYEAHLAAAKGTRKQAGFFKNPQASVEVGGREVRDSENVLQGNGYTLGVSVTQIFEFPGKGSLRKAIANKNVDIAELGLAQFRLSLTGKIRLLACEHLAARAEAKAAEEIHQRIQHLITRLQRHPVAGARTRIELGLIQARLLELGASIKNAAARVEETRTELNALLGRPQNLPLAISGAIPLPTMTFSDTALVFAAQDNNPLLQIRRKELERSLHEVSATRLDVAPDFSIGPFFSRDVAGDTEQNIGGMVSATLPIWDWNAGNIQSAKARAASAEAERIRAEREVEAQILNRIRAHELIRRQIEMMPAGLLEELSEASSLANTQFQKGSIGAQLYLDSQSAYLDALRVSQEAALDAWRTILDLNLLSGGALEKQPVAAASTGAKAKQ